MKIEVGKKYVTRNGDIVSIVEYDEVLGGEWPFLGSNWCDRGTHGNSWDESGRFLNPETNDKRDIVSEWVPDVTGVQWTPQEIAFMSGHDRVVRFDDNGPRNACLVPEDSDTRKSIPVTTGVLDYFPLAIVAVAQISKAGNEKHNPGEPMHWSRGKAADHADCIGRHLIDRGRFAEDGTRHSAALAWRALALLQEELEAEAGTGPVSR